MSRRGLERFRGRLPDTRRWTVTMAPEHCPHSRLAAPTDRLTNAFLRPIFQQQS